MYCIVLYDPTPIHMQHNHLEICKTTFSTFFGVSTKPTKPITGTYNAAAAAPAAIFHSTSPTNINRQPGVL
jgi:hypothetical protein